MDLNFLDNRGVPLEQQRFTWRDMAGKPISKLDDDAFTRVRVILMNGIESDALRLKHLIARFDRDPQLRLALAQVRRAEQHQQTMVNWLLSADHSPIETTIGYEQVAVEVTASLAQNEVFIDKLGERLAYERSGIRLYEAVLARLENGTNEAEALPPLAEVEHISDEEAKHFKMLVGCLEKLGADPTAQTPCADSTAVQSLGVVQALSDPRTTVAQALNALVTIELVDNAGWELLIKLAEQTGQDEMAAGFRTALQEEAEHLQKVQTWLERELLEQAT